MYLIDGLTNDPKQIQTVILPNGKEATVAVEYKPMQTGWFLTLTYGAFQLNNLRIVTNPNILHQFKNLLPFGIGCFVDANQEALLADDFASGRAKLYILDKSEVVIFDEVLSGQVTA